MFHNALFRRPGLVLHLGGVLLAVLLLAGFQHSAPVTSQELRQLITTDRVLAYQTSPNSQWIIYAVQVGEEYGNGVLYSQRIGTNQRIQLGEYDNGSFEISPDSSRVLIHLRAKGLFSVPITGGELVRLSLEGQRTLPGSYKISPDSKWVVYPATNDSSPIPVPLYSVSIAGGTPTQLGMTRVYQGSTNNPYLHISDDSQSVIAVDGSAQFLYQIPIGGGTARRLMPDNVTFGPYGGIPFQFIDDTLIVAGCTDGSRTGNLYHVSLSTGTVRQITNFPSTYTQLSLLGVGEATRPSRLMFSISRETGEHQGDIPLSVGEDYSIELAGTGLIRLNNPKGAYGMVSPDNTHVIYIANTDPTTQQYTLLSLPVAGGELKQLASRAEWFVGFNADYSQIVFKYPVNLMTVPITGGPQVKLNVVPPKGQKVVYVVLSPDRQWVLYGFGTGESDPPNIGTLYSVPASGGTSRKLSSALAPDGQVVAFEFTADGKKVIYSALEGNVVKLYAVSDVEPLLLRGDGTLRDTYFPLAAR